MTSWSAIPTPQALFPTLDVAALDTSSLKPAVYLNAFEREEFTELIRIALPHIAHAVRRISDTRSEQEFINIYNGAAVHLVLTLDPFTHEVLAHIAEIGIIGLWDEIVITTAQWDQDAESIGRAR